MKKILAAALALFPFVASAVEISPGTIQLKGDSSIGYTSSTSETKYMDGTKDPKEETTTLEAGIQGLYYLLPGIGVGGVISYLDETTKVGPNKTTFDALLVGPAIGLDFSLTPQVGLFAEAAAGYASGGQKSSGPAVTNTERVGLTGYGFQAAGGVKLFLERHFSFDVGLAYQYLSLKNKDEKFGKPETTISGVGLNLGLSVYFGGK